MTDGTAASSARLPSVPSSVTSLITARPSWTNGLEVEKSFWANDSPWAWRYEGR